MSELRNAFEWDLEKSTKYEQKQNLEQKCNHNQMQHPSVKDSVCVKIKYSPEKARGKANHHCATIINHPIYQFLICVKVWLLRASDRGRELRPTEKL
jgi:hypothetical protein